MGKAKFYPSLLLAALLVLVRVSVCPLPQPPGTFHPLCVSQFALAAHACATISYEPEPHSSKLSSIVPLSLVPLPGFDNLYHSHSHGRNHNHSHSHGRSHGHKHRHRRRRRHHHHHHHQTVASRECCRWLKAIDAICICDLLLRLPVFLARPIHGYKVLVDDACKIEYKCPGRFGRFMAQP